MKQKVFNNSIRLIIVETKLMKLVSVLPIWIKFVDDWSQGYGPQIKTD